MLDVPHDPAETHVADDAEATETLEVTVAPWLDVMRDLAQLAGQLGRVQEKVAARRQEVDTPRAAAGDRGRDDLERALARIEHKIDGLTGLVSVSNQGSTSVVPEEDPNRPGGWGGDLEAREAALDALLAALAPRLGRLSSEAPQPVPAGTTSSGPGFSGDVAGDLAARWAMVILGEDLWSNPEIEADRRRLLESFLNRDPAACTLAGCLLLFHAAPAERIPQLIKDLGEAYYRWQPRVTEAVTPFESALSGWAVKAGESAGVRNRIELVRPGSRFNPQQHKALERGVEVTQALGWVVLREDGSVFQKASVAVK